MASASVQWRTAELNHFLCSSTYSLCHLPSALALTSLYLGYTHPCKRLLQSYASLNTCSPWQSALICPQQTYIKIEKWTTWASTEPWLTAKFKHGDGGRIFPWKMATIGQWQGINYTIWWSWGWFPHHPSQAPWDWTLNLYKEQHRLVCSAATKARSQQPGWNLKATWM